MVGACRQNVPQRPQVPDSRRQPCYQGAWPGVVRSVITALAVWIDKQASPCTIFVVLVAVMSHYRQVLPNPGYRSPLRIVRHHRVPTVLPRPAFRGLIFGLCIELLAFFAVDFAVRFCGHGSH